VSRTPTPRGRPLWWPPPTAPPLIVVLVVRSTLYLGVIALAGVLVVLGSDVRMVAGFVAVVASAAAAASLRLTGAALVAGPPR
jgi:hypothetical protein